jgi:uncharacterized membrane protein YkoI
MFLPSSDAIDAATVRKSRIQHPPNEIMKSIPTILATGVILITSIAPAQAREVRFADCPQPVQATINSNTREGRIDEVEMVQIKGQTVYVAEIDLKGDLDLRIHVAPDGTLIKTVEDQRLSAVPEAVRTALLALGGHVDDIDKITTGSTITYEVDIDRHGAPDLDVIVAADGKIIRQTEDRDDD